MRVYANVQLDREYSIDTVPTVSQSSSFKASFLAEYASSLGCQSGALTDQVVSVVVVVDGAAEWAAPGAVVVVDEMAEACLGRWLPLSITPNCDHG